MAVVPIFKLTVIVFSLTIIQSEIVAGQNECPLQCQCVDSNSNRRMDVTCVKPNFKELPIFPRSTTHIDIKGDSKVSKIYKGALFRLSHLKTFILHSGQTWTFERGVFDNLVTLKSLNIRSYVPNTLPADVLRGLDLQTLKLNLRSRALPYNGICGQRHLAQLDLSYNNLQKLTLPKCVNNMTMLSALMLNSNQFTILYEEDFGFLGNSRLKVLSVSMCRIVDVHEDVFQPLVHITTIYMDGNRISHLPQNVFRNLWNSTYLNLARNWFTDLPCNAFRHVTALKKLFLQELPKISDANVCQQFSSLPRLYLVYLDNTRMSHINDTTLLPLKQVRSLKLTVQSFSKEALAVLSHLNNLLLTGGHINLTGLTNVVIGLNKTDIQKFTVQLTSTIKSLPDELFLPLSTSRLTSLTMTTCYIKHVGRDTFSPLNNLQKLDLSRNYIESFPTGTFRLLVNLKTLILNNNHIIDFIRGYSIDPWELPPSIEYIQVGANNIRHINPDCLQGLDNLTYLSLSRNQVQTIFKNSLTSSSLKNIRLSRNYIVSIDSRAFVNTPRLTSIDLSNSRIVMRLDSKGLLGHVSELTWLNLEGVSFSRSGEEQILPTMFSSLRNLQHLSLRKCKISTLQYGTFLSNANLRLLVLSTNKLSHWRPELFQPLIKLEKLLMSENQIMTVRKVVIHAFDFIADIGFIG